MNRKFSVIVLLLILVAALACGPFGSSKPTITIIAPPNGSQIAVGQTVEVQFRAEDSEAVVWVQMSVGSDVVATQESPVEGGQATLEGILRWVPTSTGTARLELIAHNADNQDSDPAAVSIEVVAGSAGAPTPTPIPTSGTSSQATSTPRPTTRPGQATNTPQPTTRPAQATNTPQPTATPRPSQPTNTPQPTTQPSPEIVAFISDKTELYPGECVTLQWTTRNADEVYFDQFVVAVPAGERIVCYDELSLGLVSFRLSAVNAVDSVFEDLAIEVKPPEQTTIGVPFVPDMSGSVSDDGRVLDTVYPGDDGADTDYQGFITFDIRGLPGNATIVTALLDLGPCTTNGEPWNLSDLHVSNLQYGDLNATDYNAGGAYITSISGPCYAPIIDVAPRVEAMKAELYFQLRIYFDGSDFDGTTDDVTYTAPTLEITYTIQ